MSWKRETMHAQADAPLNMKQKKHAYNGLAEQTEIFGSMVSDKWVIHVAIVGQATIYEFIERFMN